ncbi:creatininase family protein [Bacteroidota bacterium]
MKTQIKNLMIIAILFFLFSISSTAQDNKQPTTRLMNLICWQEFQEIVPEHIETVLLPVGSLEPHGVIPNGTDNLAPESMAQAIAGRLNAMIAPTLNYGITPAMKAFPGAVTISREAYKLFTSDILAGLADNKFKNIIILNGHGGNSTMLEEVATNISLEKNVRILVTNWWSMTADITQEVFGEDGGHAGNNETAYVQASYPEHIHPERFTKDMAIPNPLNNAFKAIPVPSSILLYKKGEGYPTFDKKQADIFFKKVNDRMVEVIADIIKKWDLAKLYK